MNGTEKSRIFLFILHFPAPFFSAFIDIFLFRLVYSCREIILYKGA